MTAGQPTTGNRQLKSHSKLSIMYKIFTSVLFTLFLSVSAFAQDGTLDPTFADAGILIGDYAQAGADLPNDLVVQADGKIVVAMNGRFDEVSNTNDLALLRLNEDGTLDPTFGDAGIFVNVDTMGSDLAYSLLQLEDGSFLFIGSMTSDSENPDDVQMAVLKVSNDGVLDTDFGTDGIVQISIAEGQDYARDAVVDADGKIYLAGFSYVSGFSNRRNVMVGLNADGSLNTEFGADGIFIWNDNETVNELHHIIIAQDGNFLVNGYSKPAGTDRMTIYKVLADGSGLDTTFGTDGEVLTTFDGNANGNGIFQRPNGDLVVAGHTSNAEGGLNFVAAAYTADGAVDTDWGTNGSVQAMPDLLNFSYDAMLQPDGKLLITGEAGAGFFGDPRRFATARFTADGELDATWGEAGIVQTPFPSEFFNPFSFAEAVAMQPDGKILVLGKSAQPGGNQLAMARYNNVLDADGDGFDVTEDCDDDNAAINPDATEIPYNGIDDDCNEMTPDDDIDGDGFVNDEDCDDNNADINPDATEIVYDGIDNDCNAATLDDDLDEDGFANAEDCDDDNAAINPDATEIPYNGIDDDCNEMTPDDDIDNDGFVNDEDCDDNDAAINPDAVEIANNGIDEDCDGEDLISSVDESFLAAQFEISPNPTDGSVLLTSGENAPTVLEIRVFDYTGKLLEVVDSQAFGNQISLDFGKYAAGTYMVSLLTEEGNAVKRIIRR